MKNRNKKLGLNFGIAYRNVLHNNLENQISLEHWFARVSEAGVFDYVDKTPPLDEINTYEKLSQKYELPILCGGWFYVLGRDEKLLFTHLKNGSDIGTKIHNVQIKYKHYNGYPVSNKEIIDIYLRSAEYGEKIGCIPSFEIHINMWSEDFLRIFDVASKVESYGVPFRMTLDHSHIIFKIDNEQEMKLFELSKHIQNGSIVLDPYKKGNLAQKLINSNYVNLLHARSVIPNNPKNIRAKHPDGTVGRGVQYPFIKPLEDEYHSEWDESKLDPWKEVVRKLIHHHKNVKNSPLKYISTEFIPATDYGEGNKYSLFDNSIACAKWIIELLR